MSLPFGPPQHETDENLTFDENERLRAENTRLQTELETLKAKSLIDYVVTVPDAVGDLLLRVEKAEADRATLQADIDFCASCHAALLGGFEQGQADRAALIQALATIFHEREYLSLNGKDIVFEHRSKIIYLDGEEYSTVELAIEAALISPATPAPGQEANESEK